MKQIWIYLTLLMIVPHHTKSNFIQDVGVAVTVGVCVGSAIYIMFSEPNQVKIDRAYSVINKYQEKLDAVLLSVNSFENMCLLSRGFSVSATSTSGIAEWIDEIDKAYADICNRHSSFLMLTNRCAQMDNAYHDITMLHQKALLIKLVRDNEVWFNCHQQGDVQPMTLVQCALVLNDGIKQCPITASVKDLQATIATLRAMRIDFPIKSILLEYLQRVCGTLMTSQQYQQEVRYKQEYFG